MMEVIKDGDLADITEMAGLIIDGVESADDLAGIFAFVRQVVPSASPSCLQDLNTIDYAETSQTNLFTDMVIGQAHAQSKGALALLKRINIKPFFKKLRKSLDKMDVTEEKPSATPKKFNVAKFIANLGTTLAALDTLDPGDSLSDGAKELVENILDDRVILASMVVTNLNSASALSALIKGKMPLRMKPIELMFAIAQIEGAISDGKLDSKNYTLDLVKPRTTPQANGREVKWKIRDKYGKVFIEIHPKNSKDKKRTAYIHVNAMNGEAFHLATIASLLADNKTIIGIESNVNIQFYRSGVSGDSDAFGKPLLRRVDIVTGSLGDAQWWEVKSLGYNRQNAKTGKQNKGITSGLTTLDLKGLSAQIDKKKNQVKVVTDQGKSTTQKDSLKIKAGQFYSKEFFVDRVYATSDLAKAGSRMQWVLQDFKKNKMPAFEKIGKKYVVADTFNTATQSKTQFLQCGVNKTQSSCSEVYGSKTDPLNKIREKLVNSIRTSNQKDVEDVIFQTFADDFDDKGEVSDYTNGFKVLAPQIIKSANARDWMVKSGLIPNATCEADNG